MRIALGSDLHCELTDSLERLLRERKDEVVLFGALSPGSPDDWPSVGGDVARAVVSGNCVQGIVCCWTGTGVSIAANKVSGARAALCFDAETARGARTWNDANVLALSIRATTPAVAEEILTAWFSSHAASDGTAKTMIDTLKASDSPQSSM